MMTCFLALCFLTLFNLVSLLMLFPWREMPSLLPPPSAPSCPSFQDQLKAASSVNTSFPMRTKHFFLMLLEQGVLLAFPAMWRLLVSSCVLLPWKPETVRAQCRLYRCFVIQVGWLTPPSLGLRWEPAGYRSVILHSTPSSF